MCLFLWYLFCCCCQMLFWAAEYVPTYLGSWCDYLLPFSPRLRTLSITCTESLNTYHVPGTGNETVCVPFYCSPSVYREMCLDIHCTKFVDLYKYSEISKKENKGGPLFFSSRFTQGNVLPVYIQWNPLLLNAFTIYTCSHFMSILSRCHWYNVQMVLSKLCLDHLWNIVC